MASSWSTPATFVAGTMATAAQMNLNVRDNLSWIAVDSPRCRSTHSANQALANNVAGGEILAFDSEDYDVGGMHQTSATPSPPSNTRITIPTGGDGYYGVGGNVSIAANATGTRGILIKKNTTLVIASLFCQAGATASINTELATSTMIHAVAGDHFTLWAYQASGAGLNVVTLTNYSPVLWATWQGA